MLVLEAGCQSVDFALGFILFLAVTGLDLAGQLFTLAIDFSPVIVRQLAPLFLGGTLKFGPFTFDLIPVHGISPLVRQITMRAVRACV